MSVQLIEPEVYIEYHRISNPPTFAQRLHSIDVHRANPESKRDPIPVRIVTEKDTGETVFYYLM